MSSSALAFVKLLRPANSTMTVIAVLIGVLIANGNIFSFAVLMACISAFFIVAGGFAINDFFDSDIDIANNRNRPIPKGLLSPQQAKAFGYLLLSLGVISTWFTGNLLAIFIALTGAFLLHLYSKTIKKKNAILGNLVTSYSAAISFVYGWAINVTLLDKAIVVLSITFTVVIFASMAREFIKGIQDIEGDEKAKIKTAARVFGTKTTAYLATISILVAIVLSPIPFLLGALGVGYMILMSIADIMALVSCLYMIRHTNGSTKREYTVVSNIAGKAKNSLLISMAISVLALGLGLLL